MGNLDNILTRKLVVLSIVTYMMDNHVDESELADKLSVSVEYISRFLNGQVFEAEFVDKLYVIIPELSSN